MLNLLPLWDPQFVAAARSWGGVWLLHLLTITTQFADTPFLFFILPLIFWSINKKLAKDLVWLYLLADASNVILKSIVKYPRPFWLNQTLLHEKATGFSFPSGHTQIAGAVYGYLSWRVFGLWQWGVWRLVLSIFFIAFIIAIAVSRMYLGDHFLGDTMGGGLIGLLLAVIYNFYKPRLFSKIQFWSVPTHIIVAIIVVVVIVGLTYLGLNLSWGVCNYISECFSLGYQATLHDAAGVAGSTFAFWIGLVLENKYVRFHVNVPFLVRILRYGGGVFGVMGMMLLRHLFLSPHDLWLDLLEKFLYMAIVSFWIAFVWPWMFNKWSKLDRSPQNLYKIYWKKLSR